jgi:hypothetical protein
MLRDALFAVLALSILRVSHVDPCTCELNHLCAVTIYALANPYSEYILSCKARRSCSRKTSVLGGCAIRLMNAGKSDAVAYRKLRLS